MHGNEQEAQFFMMFGDKKVPLGEPLVASINKTIERKPENTLEQDGDNLLLKTGLSGTIEMKDVEFLGAFHGNGQSLFDQHQRVNIEMTGYRLPRGKRFPKKKRIRNKWKKKYGETFMVHDVMLLPKKGETE